jgi:serine/threonine protein kinase
MSASDDEDIFHFEPDNSVVDIERDFDEIIINSRRVSENDTVLNIHDFVSRTAEIQQSHPQRGPQKAFLEDFAILSVIGQGAYGQVFLVRKKDSNDKLFAMKVLRKAAIVLHGKEKEHTENERNILEAISHPFIVKLYYAFQCPARLYLILSYASGGELFSYLSQERMFSDDVARFYISEIYLGLEHLHSLGIIYRFLLLT